MYAADNDYDRVFVVDSMNLSTGIGLQVLKACRLRDAGKSAVILVNNHPSGDPSPSSEDISLTKRLQQAGRIMDIRVLDHVIIGGDAYCSLKEKGFME